MIIKSIDIEKFRAFENVTFQLGKNITAISGRNATQKTTLLGMLGQPFTISSTTHPMYGCRTIDGYNFRSQFKEKFKISKEHDKVGEHRWKIDLYNGIHEKNYYSIESIARKQTGKESSLRFWNSESRSKGAGYIQLPVYFLSLSRLFPIGESGKTQPAHVELTQAEEKYCINNYRTILSIQSNSSNSMVGIEKGTSTRTFPGVSDDIHDIFTNSAGEGNIMRIILAILSFARLKEKFSKEYHGGLLLIDELDATLYSFSQEKLVDYLYNASKEYRIQIVFTTHSSHILKKINKLQRNELKRNNNNQYFSNPECSIVYLEPDYDNTGRRIINAKNISTANEVNAIINNISLQKPNNSFRINVYCEDSRATCFIQHLLQAHISSNLNIYMNFVDVDLGWSNYIQLVGKKIPEFCKNIIVLDEDVLYKHDYSERQKIIVNSAGNIIFLPLTIEKDLFKLLKDHATYIHFQSTISQAKDITYDVCFNNWPLEIEEYSTNDFKIWYSQLEEALGNQTLLFDFWINTFPEKADSFVNQFIEIYNKQAEKNDFDMLPN